MADFSTRSSQSELMDSLDPVPEPLLRQWAKELSMVNRLLGGYRAVTAGLDRLTRDRSRRYSIVDYGCGGGGVLVAIAEWARKRSIEVDLVGVDINPAIADFTRRTCAAFPNISVVTGDVFTLGDQVHDITTSTLFWHHLGDADLKRLITLMWERARLGVVVNDLHRHPLAFYGIGVLTALFSRSIFVKNDGPISVLRAFRRAELVRLIEDTPMSGATIEWRWAFRYLITARKP